jgi:hypothetical protein
MIVTFETKQGKQQQQQEEDEEEKEEEEKHNNNKSNRIPDSFGMQPIPQHSATRCTCSHQHWVQ